MLPLQANRPVEPDILLTQNVREQDQIQSQVYSLLTDANSSPARKKASRKKTTRLNTMVPVIVNPEMVRESPDKTSTTHHHHHDHSSTRVPQYLPPFLSMHPIDDTQLLFRVHLDSPCDTSNKTAMSHKPVHLPLKSSNHSSFHQNLQNFLPTNESSPIHNADSVPLTMAQSEYHGLDPYLTRHIYPPLLYVDRNSPSVSRQYSRPMSLPSIPTLTVSKPKRSE